MKNRPAEPVKNRPLVNFLVNVWAQRDPSIVFTHTGFFSTSDSIALRYDDSTHGYMSSYPTLLLDLSSKQT
jgi:hypothetical protein